MTLGRVRSLERKLILERAEAVVPLIVDTYVYEWDPDNPEYPLELAVRIRRAGITLPGYGNTLAYLENCRRRKQTPNPKHLTYALLPWTVQL